MKVILDGRAVFHFNFIIEPKKKGNHTTLCEIRRTRDNNPATGNGTARCNPIDKYDQIMGKTKALDRALKQMFPRTIDRECRMYFWRAFYRTLQGTEEDIQRFRRKQLKPFYGTESVET
jgi:hypothetical protein